MYFPANSPDQGRSLRSGLRSRFGEHLDHGRIGAGSRQFPVLEVRSQAMLEESVKAQAHGLRRAKRQVSFIRHGRGQRAWNQDQPENANASHEFTSP